MFSNITFDDFAQIFDDFSGVYALYLKNDTDLDIFIPTIKEQILLSAKKNDNLIYIGESRTIMRRIYANHLQGVGASTLRNTLFAFMVKNVSSSKSVIINKWLKENTYFKIYKTNEHCQVEKFLISKFNPVLNEGRRKFKNEIEKYLLG